MDIPRSEHPRPDFYRSQWQNLNGAWEFEFHGTYPLGDHDVKRHPKFSREINVPFPYQSALSGVGNPGIFPCVWYRRYFELPETWEQQRVILRFGAVDYQAWVWLNGKLLGAHRGGHTPFGFDITEALRAKANELVVKVFDPLNLDQPRGKQSWGDPTVCWYTQTTGIWQTVWLEAAPEDHLQSCRILPDLDDGSVTIFVRPATPCPHLTIQAEALYDGKSIGAIRRQAAYPLTQLRIALEDMFPWTPETPNLYDLELSLLEGDTVVDAVTTYCGMRKVSLSRTSVLLNNTPYYQRLVLDQGFWPDGLYTAPTDEALKADIEWAKKMGFNGCRKHQKVEDPRFLYWADKLGFLVWGEFPANYEHSLSGEAKLLPEWQAALERDINHPCIVAWTPFNESWGLKEVRQNPETQRWLKDVVQMTRLIDPTRLVIDNDGWEHVESDIYGYHDYTPGEALVNNCRDLLARARQETDAGQAKPNSGREMMAEGVKMPNMPIMNTEFGGIGFVVGEAHADAWGYVDLPETRAAFQQRYEATFDAIFRLSELCGYVYTQLTDVEQEINGLLTAERNPKFDVNWLKRVNEGVIQKG